MMKTIVSATAKASGWGSDMHKRVTFLTKEEREHIRRGTARVVITGCPPSGGGNGTGTTTRMVVATRENGFTHRLPDAECELAS